MMRRHKIEKNEQNKYYFIRTWRMWERTGLQRRAKCALRDTYYIGGYIGINNCCDKQQSQQRATLKLIIHYTATTVVCVCVSFFYAGFYVEEAFCSPTRIPHRMLPGSSYFYAKTGNKKIEKYSKSKNDTKCTLFLLAASDGIRYQTLPSRTTRLSTIVLCRTRVGMKHQFYKRSTTAHRKFRATYTFTLQAQTQTRQGEVGRERVREGDREKGRKSTMNK